MEDKEIANTVPEAVAPAAPSDFRDTLPADLKGDPSLANLSSVESLASAYVSANKQLSKNHPGPGKEDSWEDFSKKTSNFFKTPKTADEYKHEYEGDHKERVTQIAHKCKIHPKQVKPFVDELLKAVQVKGEVNTSQRVEQWKKETSEVYQGVEGKDEVLGRAFKKLGETNETIEAKLGAVRHNPIIAKLFLKLGEAEASTKGLSKGPIGSDTPKNEIGILEKLSYVQKYMRDLTSPYHNQQHPSHFETKRTVNEYVAVLSDFQRKNPSDELAGRIKIY